MTFPPELYDFINRLGAMTCLVVFVLGLRQGWWVMGREYDRMTAENAALREQARQDAETIQKSVHATWQMVGTVRDATRPNPN